MAQAIPRIPAAIAPLREIPPSAETVAGVLGGSPSFSARPPACQAPRKVWPPGDSGGSPTAPADTRPECSAHLGQPQRKPVSSYTMPVPAPQSSARP